jgi:hypothetical protein
MGQKIPGTERERSSRREVWLLIATISIVVVAGAGVIPVPPVGASGIESLAPQPLASTIAVSVGVVPGPPSDSDPNKVIVEIVEVFANDVLAIVVVPPVAVAMPPPGTVVPSILASAAAADMPTTLPIPTGILAPAASTADIFATTAPARVMATTTTPSKVASMPAAPTKVATASTHATEVAASSATSTNATATATAAASTDERNVTLGGAERSLQVRDAGVRLPPY